MVKDGDNKEFKINQDYVDFKVATDGRDCIVESYPSGSPREADLGIQGLTEDEVKELVRVRDE